MLEFVLTLALMGGVVDDAPPLSAAPIEHMEASLHGGKPQKPKRWWSWWRRRHGRYNGGYKGGCYGGHGNRPVPGPLPLALLSLGVLGVGGAARSRRRKRKQADASTS
ncbi:MAG: hypothetical protein ACYS5W_18375 [Planctomycetota bacterium]|jgi:hypothetical protein